MRLLLYFLVAPVFAVGVVATAVLVQSHAALSPVVQASDAAIAGSNQPQSLEALYQTRDRLKSELQSQPPVSPGTQQKATTIQRLQALQAVEVRIEIEERAQRDWYLAVRAANTAGLLAGQTDPMTAPRQTLKQLQTLWQEAVTHLRAIPEDSLMRSRAAEKLVEYSQNFATASYYVDASRSRFLQEIADRTGMADRLHITVCTLKRECRRYRGNEAPASPASLIKLPVAIALTHKLTTEKLSPQTEIYIDSSNWTESSGRVGTGQPYTLERLLTDMISYSGNVSTNQLIDYLGWDYINQVMRDRGYTDTRVSFKMVGEETFPSAPGTQPNTLTTDNLTGMMVSIYNVESPGDDLIQKALLDQQDRQLGYAAIQPPAVWNGEKTGQNSRALGTTMGIMIDNEKYILTVVLDYSGNEATLRQVIAEVVQYIQVNAGF
jgi:beta-lactamase class A